MTDKIELADDFVVKLRDAAEAMAGLVEVMTEMMEHREFRHDPKEDAVMLAELSTMAIYLKAAASVTNGRV